MISQITKTGELMEMEDWTYLGPETYYERKQNKSRAIPLNEKGEGLLFPLNKFKKTTKKTE
ncbi:MAG: hypothetical protein E3K36_13250 [Candidatus Brocadia sp.]|nr:hypothetical protein [Candidatus Brocadia sp.]